MGVIIDLSQGSNAGCVRTSSELPRMDAKEKGEPQMNPPPLRYGATGTDGRRYGRTLRSEISKFICVHLR